MDLARGGVVVAAKADLALSQTNRVLAGKFRLTTMKLELAEVMV